MAEREKLTLCPNTEGQGGEEIEMEAQEITPLTWRTSSDSGCEPESCMRSSHVMVWPLCFIIF